MNFLDGGNPEEAKKALLTWLPKLTRDDMSDCLAF